MVLSYLGEQVDYDRLLRLLGTTEAGTPFPQIARMTALGLFVEENKHRDDLALFDLYLDLKLPVIVAVQTWALEHWAEVDTEHAVVVVGLDDQYVYINDPAFEADLQAVAIYRFLHAWTYRDYQYAIIGLIAPE